jgi:hypothetical protein
MSKRKVKASWVSHARFATSTIQGRHLVCGFCKSAPSSDYAQKNIYLHSCFFSYTCGVDYQSIYCGCRTSIVATTPGECYPIDNSNYDPIDNGDRYPIDNGDRYSYSNA